MDLTYVFQYFATPDKAAPGFRTSAILERTRTAEGSSPGATVSRC